MAGLPPARALSGTSTSTVEPAPMSANAQTRTDGTIVVPAPDHRCQTNDNVTYRCEAGPDVHAIGNFAVVINRRARVYDDVTSQTRAAIDHAACHNDGAFLPISQRPVRPAAVDELDHPRVGSHVRRATRRSSCGHYCRRRLRHPYRFSLFSALSDRRGRI